MIKVLTVAEDIQPSLLSIVQRLLRKRRDWRKDFVHSRGLTTLSKILTHAMDTKNGPVVNASIKCFEASMASKGALSKLSKRSELLNPIVLALDTENENTRTTVLKMCAIIMAEYGRRPCLQAFSYYATEMGEERFTVLVDVLVKSKNLDLKDNAFLVINLLINAKELDARVQRRREFNSLGLLETIQTMKANGELSANPALGDRVTEYLELMEDDQMEVQDRAVLSGKQVDVNKIDSVLSAVQKAVEGNAQLEADLKSMLLGVRE
tara:strand:- start:89 stop:886 length:798 start_codon:yes stop_codon:yes gene_type:complete